MKDISEFLTEQLHVNEAEEIKDEKEFRAFVHAKLKKEHGENYDEKKADKVANGVLADNKDLVDKGDWGALVGIINKGSIK